MKKYTMKYKNKLLRHFKTKDSNYKELIIFYYY